MNKKRVALALAAALSVSTLMVTVGEVGGQARVAHAQNARLTNPDDVKKLDGISIKTLDTTVENVTGSDVTLTFKGLTKDNVKDVTGTLSYTKFTERTGDNNGSVRVTWDATNGKAKASGLNAPGIYSGDITIEYKDGAKETYTITLKKVYEQEVLNANVEVGIGKIVVSNITLGTKSINPSTDETVELQLNGKVLGTATTAVGLTFGNLDIKEGQVYDLVYKNKGAEVARTQIFLTKQDTPTVTVTPTNDKAVDDVNNALKTQIETDYGLAAGGVLPNKGAAPGAGVSNVQTTFTVNGNVVSSYVQALNSAGDVGGAKITAANVSNDQVSLTFDTTASLDYEKANFIPSMWLNWGPKANTASNVYVPGAYGKVAVSINGGTPETIVDLTSGVQAAVEQVEDDATNKIVVLTLTNATESATNPINLGNTNFNFSTASLPHGYTTVGVDFTVADSPIGGKNLATWIGDVNGKRLSSGQTADTTATPKNPSNNTTGVVTGDEKFTTNTVKTSLVVAKDAVDGAVVNAKFEKTSASEGKLILTGGDALLKGTDANTLAGQLTVNGSNSGISFSNKETNGDLVFRVQFNGQVPSTITWRLNGLGSTIDVVTVDAVNFDGEVKPSNTNTNRLDDQFDIEAKFNSTVPTGGTLQFDNLASTRVTFAQLTNGSHKISKTTTSGKYQGTYAAGIVVSVQPMGLKITKTESNTAGRVDLTIDGTFFNTDDYKNVTAAKIQYREKGTSNWTNANVTFTVGENSDISTDAQKDKTITKSVTGLTANKDYEFQVIYDYKEGNNTIAVTSNIATQKVSNSSSSNNTISGSGSTTSGTSTGSTTINVTTNNSTLTGTSASVKLPSGFRYDSGKTPVATTFKYKDKNGKVVTETKEQFSNVTVKFNGDNIEVNGLVPGKNYDEITVDYTDNNGRTRSIILRNIQTTSQTQVETYLANVYTVVFDRPADEAGYHFHLDNLKNKRVSLREFLLNMLSEKEFIEKYVSTEEKIEALYSAIVARSSDEAGKKFWVDEYTKALKVYGSESTALKAIADRMVNENELKELADRMGVQW